MSRMQFKRQGNKNKNLLHSSLDKYPDNVILQYSVKEVMQTNNLLSWCQAFIVIGWCTAETPAKVWLNQCPLYQAFVYMLTMAPLILSTRRYTDTVYFDWQLLKLCFDFIVYCYGTWCVCVIHFNITWKYFYSYFVLLFSEKDFLSNICGIFCSKNFFTVF